MALRIRPTALASSCLLFILAIILILGTVALRGGSEEPFIRMLRDGHGTPRETYPDGRWKLAMRSIQADQDLFVKREYFEQHGDDFGMARWEIETPTRTIVCERDRPGHGQWGPERVIRDERSLLGILGMPGPPWLYQATGGLACVLGVALMLLPRLLTAVGPSNNPTAGKPAAAGSRIASNWAERGPTGRPRD